MSLKNKKETQHDSLFKETLKEFPAFVRNQQSSMKKNQAMITRMTKAIEKEFLKKGIKIT